MKYNIKSLYIHIPFCSSICSYCDFCKLFYNEKLVDTYLEALEKEIKENYKNDILETIYIGGGSPSSLNLRQLEKLFSILKPLKLAKSIEFTIEVNISDITEEKLLLFKRNGVNRLSIGVETINKKFSSFLNRVTDYDLTLNKINLAKKYFSNINVDLMYAFPKQKMTDLRKDLEFIKKIDVEHVSLYSLIIEEHTKLYIDKILPTIEELDSAMYYNIISYLKSIGYNHYEISNFSKKGYASLHNLTYWNNLEYYGFGLGASGYVNNKRYTNTRNINNYIKGNYLLEEEEITPNIAMENEMILGLRKTIGISKKKFKEKFGFNVQDVFDIIELKNKNLLKEDDDRLYIPEERLYVSNSILVNFIGGSIDGK